MEILEYLLAVPVAMALLFVYLLVGMSAIKAIAAVDNKLGLESLAAELLRESFFAEWLWPFLGAVFLLGLCFKLPYMAARGFMEFLEKKL